MPGPYNGTGTGSQPVYATAASGFGQCMNFTSNGTVTMNPDASGAGNPFTISFRFNSTSAYATAIQLNGSGNADGIAIENGQIIFSWSSFQGYTAGTAGQYNDGAWHTVAMCGKPSTGDVYCFIDGTLVHHDTNLSSTANEHLTVVGNTGLTCLIDEVAWFNGTCLYTASYTAPTAPWPNSTAGLDALYHFDGNLNDSTGVGPSAGTLTQTKKAQTTATVVTTAATGGTSPYTYQFQRAPDVSGSPGSYANVGMAGVSRTLNDTGLTANTKYWYQCVVTDSASNTATSSAITFTTLATGEVPFFCMGDSITEGYNNTTPSVQNPVFHLTNILTSVALPNSGTARIISSQNSGVVGSTTANWQPGQTDYVNAVASALALGCTVCSILLGANDLLGSVSTATYKANMLAIANDLVSTYGMTVVLQSLPYITGTGSTTNIQAYNTALTQIANGSTIILGDTFSYGVFQANYAAVGAGNTGSYFQSDVLHPTPLGADILGGLWEASVGKQVGVNIGSGGANALGRSGLRNP